MRVLAEIGARGVDGQRPVTLVRLARGHEQVSSILGSYTIICEDPTAVLLYIVHVPR